jgi:hypothetical protein
VPMPEFTLPQRPAPKGYVRPSRETVTYVPDHSRTLMG